MKAGGDSIGAVRASRSEEIKKKYNAEDYIAFSLGSAMGTAGTAGSVYILATEEDLSIGEKMAVAGFGAFSAGLTLPPLSGLFGGRQGFSATAYRRMGLAIEYLMSLGLVTVGAGVITMGAEKDNSGENGGPLIQVGAWVTLGGTAFLYYVIDDDISGGRRGEPGFLGELVRNVSVTPQGVSTKAEF